MFVLRWRSSLSLEDVDEDACQSLICQGSWPGPNVYIHDLDERTLWLFKIFRPREVLVSRGFPGLARSPWGFQQSTHAGANPSPWRN
jgi:hypothetical protein